MDLGSRLKTGQAIVTKPKGRIKQHILPASSKTPPEGEMGNCLFCSRFLILGEGLCQMCWDLGRKPRSVDKNLQA